jgi:hypothetical protein
MRKSLFVIFFLVSCSFLVAQQVLNNDSIVKMVKAGLSDELIATTINASPGAYDVSADAIIALKTAGASDKLVAAIVLKASAPPTIAAPPSPSAEPPGAPPTISPLPALPASSKPRVFLQSASKGNQWNAARDQSMEMGKDFDKDCPEVRVTINQQVADYTVVLNHIEVGFARDNQFQIANKDGDLISKTKEGGTIDGGVKKACKMILDDWAQKNGAPR